MGKQILSTYRDSYRCSYPCYHGYTTNGHTGQNLYVPAEIDRKLFGTVTVLNSPMHHLAKQLSDHAPLIWTISPRKPPAKGSFTARPEWIRHPMFLENATAMADAVDFAELSLEHQKECIVIITESSARAARDAIAFSDPEDNELKLMRLNSISQSIATGDAKLAAAVIRH